jgi:hypothetical protein
MRIHELNIIELSYSSNFGICISIFLTEFEFRDRFYDFCLFGVLKDKNTATVSFLFWSRSFWIKKNML